jgi:hypothetical protein
MLAARTGARFLLGKLVHEHTDPREVHQLRSHEEVVVVLNSEPQEKESLSQTRIACRQLVHNPSNRSKIA